MIINSKKDKWTIINYRNVDDLITVEFLHDLYNRHNPNVNSIRFRNTICVYKGIEFESYAPNEEWNFLGEVLGKRFSNLDKQLISEVRRYINKPKKLILKLLNENYKSIDSIENPQEILDYLLKLHDSALGEIYGINLVQLEYGLFTAIKDILSDDLSEEEVMEAIPFFLDSQDATRVVSAARTSLILSIEVSEKYIDIEKAEEKYIREFGNLNYAYGAVKDNQISKNKIKNLLEIPLDKRKLKLKNMNIKHRVKFNTNKLKKDNLYRLQELKEISEKVATLRDNNKALMGDVSYIRNKLLIRLSILTNETRNNLSRYMFHELFSLVYRNEKLSSDNINSRWEHVVFNREESCYFSDKAFEKSLQLESNNVEENHIKGTPASNGIIRGIVKHIRIASDLDRVNEGDILVAKGTDFNFMEAMIRANGFITEEGGILSHASVIARELNKPCVLGIGNIFSKIPDKSYIELDANKGYINIIEKDNTDLFNNEEPQKFINLSNASSKKSCGSKAHRLFELINRDINTLPGVVIPCSFDITTLTLNDTNSIIKELNKNSKIYSHFIVRSSSPDEDTIDKSLAGILESSVCTNNSEDLLKSIKKVNDSKNNNFIKNYYDKEEVELAFLIQPYLKQDIGGVIFTANPLNGQDEILIESSFGGASNVVNGIVDRRMIIKKENSKYEKGIYKELIDKTLEIEKIYGYPVDIEWGIQENIIYIFQVRPITTIKKLI